MLLNLPSSGSKDAGSGLLLLVAPTPSSISKDLPRPKAPGLLSLAAKLKSCPTTSAPSLIWFFKASYTTDVATDF